MDQEKLVELASELKIKNFKKMSKDDLVYAILDTEAAAKAARDAEKEAEKEAAGDVRARMRTAPKTRKRKRRPHKLNRNSRLVAVARGKRKMQSRKLSRRWTRYRKTRRRQKKGFLGSPNRDRKEEESLRKSSQARL